MRKFSVKFSVKVNVKTNYFDNELKQVISDALGRVWAEFEDCKWLEVQNLEVDNLEDGRWEND